MPVASVLSEPARTKIPTTPRPRILIADGDTAFACSLRDSLTATGRPARVGHTVSEAIDLAESSHDLYLAFVDSQIPTTGGLSLMEQLRRINPNILVIIMSASEIVAAAVDAMKRGADDYLVKPFDFGAVARKVCRLQDFLECGQNIAEHESDAKPMHPTNGFVYRSQLMEEALRRAEIASRMENSVLLVGESGVGKTMLARAIWSASRRSRCPLFRIDCRSFAHELPGRVRFLPTVEDYPWAWANLDRMIRTATEGTLFLEEVGELPHDIQGRLVEGLRAANVRESSEYGDGQRGARVLCSTSRSLDELRQNCLREDLFGFLAEAVIEIPPLRHRPEDVLPLAQHFLGRVGRRYNRQFSLGWSGLDLLTDYSYPGNIRELESILDRVAALLLQVPRKVTDGDLRPFVTTEVGAPFQGATNAEPPLGLRQVESLTINRALTLTNGNRTKAAAMLGINRATLQYKLRRMSKVKDDTHPAQQDPQVHASAPPGNSETVTPTKREFITKPSKT